MITVAFEIDGGLKFIKEVSKSAVVSVSYTDCDYKTAIKTAIETPANGTNFTGNKILRKVFI